MRSVPRGLRDHEDNLTLGSKEPEAWAVQGLSVETSLPAKSPFLDVSVLILLHSSPPSQAPTLGPTSPQSRGLLVLPVAPKCVLSSLGGMEAWPVPTRGHRPRAVSFTWDSGREGLCSWDYSMFGNWPGEHQERCFCGCFTM